MEFIYVESGVTDDELTNIVIPQSERKSAGTAVLIGKVEAVIVIADVDCAIPIVNALVIGFAVNGKSAGMVIDNIEDDGDAVGVA